MLLTGQPLVWFELIVLLVGFGTKTNQLSVILVALRVIKLIMNAPTRISVIVVIKWTILPVLVPMPGALGPVPELSFLPAPYRG